MNGHRLAVIDIGSNTIRSLVVQTLPEGNVRVLDDEREVARLASGLDGRGRLSAEAMRRAIAALGRMEAIARGRGVKKIAVVATSAIRNASNRRLFVDRVRAETGLRVRVVSGAEEARLAFESAARSFDLGDRPCAVADVGGGSSELILAIGGHIQDIYSLPLGAVSLTERFVRSDPVRGREVRALRREVRRVLEQARIAPDPKPHLLIASGGTATAVAQMAMARQGLEGRPVQGFETTQADLLHLRNALLRRTLAERRRMPGLSPDRADIILAGVTILYEMLAHLEVNVLRVSARGIRHALIERMARGPRGSAAPAAPLHRVEAAEALARSLRFEEAHGRHVKHLALSLFDQMAGPLGLEPQGRDLLAAAALLHDVGYVVAYRRHHKHTYGLIAHAQIDGFTPREREIIALTARYHRRSPPSKRHREFAALPPEDRLLVRHLSSLLRIADALDRRHSQGVRDVDCRVTRRRVRLTLHAVRDPLVERHAADAKGRAFRKAFDRELEIAVVRVQRPRRAGRGRAGRGAHRAGRSARRVRATARRPGAAPRRASVRAASPNRR